MSALLMLAYIHYNTERFAFGSRMQLVTIGCWLVNDLCINRHKLSQFQVIELCNRLSATWHSCTIYFIKQNFVYNGARSFLFIQLYSNWVVSITFNFTNKNVSFYRKTKNRVFYENCLVERNVWKKKRLPTKKAKQNLVCIKLRNNFLNGNCALNCNEPLYWNVNIFNLNKENSFNDTIKFFVVTGIYVAAFDTLDKEQYSDQNRDSSRENMFL